ncbi:MAG: YkgJ family cysteine cluster protein [Faecalibacterium sp.]|jgi:Fe-S-cluster containining protein|nr:YkgJ family cysteine cluster protein [Faecalibacterium sp.]
MKDSSVDLCGEIGYEGDDSFPVLARTDTFEFACNGCGDCCRGREDIVLSGYDLWRICAYLRLPPQIVIHAFCRHYTGENSHLPVVRLKPLAGEKNNCPFLHESHCAIHEAEPLVCALYPLGQQIELDGTVSYFAQEIDCGGEIHRARVADFLARYDIEAREPLDTKWAFTCIRLSREAKALEATLTPARMKLLQRKFYQALYLSYDFAAPYAPQFERNLAALRAEMETLSAGQKQKQG